MYDSISFYLFSDNVMPNMDGPTACEKIRVSQTKLVNELFHKFTDKKMEKHHRKLPPFVLCFSTNKFIKYISRP